MGEKQNQSKPDRLEENFLDEKLLKHSSGPNNVKATFENFYAEFRPRETNELDYDRKMSFWKELILESSKKLGKTKFTILELKERFLKDGFRPMGLNDVIFELENSNEIERYSNFNTTQGWGEWVIGSLFSVLSPKKKSNNSISQSEIFIIKSQLKEIAEKTLAEHKSEVISINSSSTLSDFNLTQSELKDISTYLTKTNQSKTLEIPAIKGSEQKKITLLKFSTDEIDQHDVASFQLKAVSSKLESQIQSLERSILESRQKAFLNKKEKDVAIIHLARAHKLQKVLLQRTKHQHQLLTILDSLDNAKTMTEVFETLKIGSSALKEANEKLNVNDVESLVLEIDDQLANIREVEDALASGNEGLNRDDPELEEELRKLEEDSNNQNNTNTQNNTHNTQNNNNNNSKPLVEEDDSDTKELEERLEKLKLNSLKVKEKEEEREESKKEKQVVLN